MAKEQYNSGKIVKLWDFLCELAKEKPEAFSSGGYLKEIVSSRWKQLHDTKNCPNCGASMLEYVFKLDFHNALLLKRMGDEVQERLNRGMDFTEANKVHVVSMDVPDYTRHRTTQVAKLGLIAKVKVDGVHATREGWLITKRGFSALRGAEVPESVIVWRNEIFERTEELVTLNEVFEAYRSRTEEQILAGKQGVSDYRAHILGYDPHEWVNFGNEHEGSLL